MNNPHRNRLRRLRILQHLQRVEPSPMGEGLLLSLLKEDQALNPSNALVRESIKYLADENLVEPIVHPNTGWMAAHITERGLAFLLSTEPNTAIDVYHPSEFGSDESQLKRITVSQLDAEMKAWLDQQLIERNFKDYDGLVSLLEEKGYEISRSTLGYYGKQLKSELRELKRSVEVAKAFAEEIGDDSAAMNQALAAMAQQETMKILREGRFKKEGIKLPDLVRSIAQLNRSDINTQRYKWEQEARLKARKEALEEAANAVEQAAQQKGLTVDQAAFWRGQVLGVKA